MATGAIAYPGFTNSHTISNRTRGYGIVRATAVIGSLTGNTIDYRHQIAGTPEYNVDGDVVRETYTGSTEYYFVLNSSEKAFTIGIECLSGTVTGGFLKASITGHTWDSISTALDTLPSISANSAGLIMSSRGSFPNNLLLLLKVTCGSNDKIAVQVI